ncbi:ryncolin-4-like [Stylophora pistillata]|uniref:Ryncolin-4 n=1 Tax=Stylophora pistillata TaxID=50429 RepID=A0A2B4RC03_STYPI|nr:ryncolin-4-like [Stylophora pistillata]PFX13825.1 Ryncolin-4 [Stylophora pistillata]
MSALQSSTSLLSVALLITIQVLSLTRAAPTVHKNSIHQGNRNERAKSCAELQQRGQTISGVFTIDPDGSGAFDVYCDQTTAGGGWTVFQRRMNRSVNFNRTLEDYKRGFGNFLIGEFWLGLEKIYRLTRNGTENNLRVDLGVKDIKAIFYAEYVSFGIGDENSSYTLNLGNLLSKTVDQDSLTYYNGKKFVIADTLCGPESPNSGGWWFEETACEHLNVNLNGAYGKNENGKIHWAKLDKSSGANLGSTPSTSEMKIRPVKCS